MPFHALLPPVAFAFTCGVDRDHSLDSIHDFDELRTSFVNCLACVHVRRLASSTAETPQPAAVTAQRLLGHLLRRTIQNVREFLEKLIEPILGIFFPVGVIPSRFVFRRFLASHRTQPVSLQQSGNHLPRMCVSIFFVQLNPPVRDQNISFTGHFAANPATNFRRGRSAKTI